MAGGRLLAFKLRVRVDILPTRRMGEDGSETWFPVH